MMAVKEIWPNQERMRAVCTIILFQLTSVVGQSSWELQSISIVLASRNIIPTDSSVVTTTAGLASRTISPTTSSAVTATTGPSITVLPTSKVSLHIVNFTAEKTVTVGDRVSIKCQVVSTGQDLKEITVSWIRSNEETIPDSTLSIQNVTAEDAGNYTCFAASGAINDTANLSLVVLVPVEIEMDVTLKHEEFDEDLKNSSSSRYKELARNFIREVHNTYKKQGYEQVNVTVLGFTEGSVGVSFRVSVNVIVRDNKEKPTKNVQVKVSNVLILEVNSTGSIGNIQVIPETLSPKVKPPSPRNLTVSDFDKTHISVKWIPPEFEKFYRVSSYSVRYREFAEKDENEKSVGSGDRTIHIGDLKPDTLYRIFVSAKNKQGFGEPSNLVDQETKADKLSSDILKILVAVLIGVSIILLSLIVRAYFTRKQKTRENETEPGVQMSYVADKVKKDTREFCFKNEGFSDLATKGSGNWREIPPQQLRFGQKLGSGRFGVVVKGELADENGERIPCAVKMLKDMATTDETKDLMNELEIMDSVGTHPNLVSLIGACISDGSLYIVVEFAEGGSLLDYLLKNVTVTDPNSGESITRLSIADRLRMQLDVARGMQHLSYMKCVHRNLAARNVLLGKNNVAKVANFGLSRDIYEQGFYEKCAAGHFPVKWMAPESLERMIFTSKTDVWSFGVLVWEIESGGKRPYPTVENKDVLSSLKKGYRMSKIPGCLDELHAMMLRCWQSSPELRPSFSDLCIDLEALQENMSMADN